MIRKDVRVGFAIGGVLLAVLVVYVLVISGSERKPAGDVTLATGDAAGAAGGSADGKDVAVADQPTITHVQSAATQKPAESKTFDVRSADLSSNGNGKSAADASKPADPIPPVNPGLSSAAQSSGDPFQNNGGADPWNKALDKGQIPVLSATETPTSQKPVTADVDPAQASGERAVNGALALGESRNAGMERVIAGSDLALPATQPSSGGRTHVVAAHETLSSIAAAAYGNSSFYPHILRANPNLDPKKLKPGMTINLPSVGEVKGTAAGDAEPRAEVGVSEKLRPAAAVDGKTQYVVQSGDSLYRIAVKLWGKADKVESLYTLNEQQIGPNRAALKVGSVLKLPEPPTLGQ